MTRAYLAFTEKGLALAQKLAGALPGTVDRCGHGGPGLADWAAEQFAHADALIFVGAVGIAACGLRCWKACCGQSSSTLTGGPAGRSGWGRCCFPTSTAHWEPPTLPHNC